MEQVVVKIDNLVKRYKELIALDHFSLEIREGEIFGLLGPNGSGKTTTINCLLSLLSFDKGKIEIFGKEMSPVQYDIKRKKHSDDSRKSQLLADCAHDESDQTSAMCRPVVGSSRIYTVLPVLRRASSLASLTRWASPPDRVVAL